MEEIRECIVLILFCIGAGAISGSDFFCRDPDTGELHDVNTTWASTTFCGNYTCRIRKKNLTETEYAPFRQINVSNMELSDNTPKKNEKNRNAEILQLKTVPNLIEDFKTKSAEKTAESDRYLTKEEIKTITEILHVVKKSDLDALVEIYKLAQDIYKEIDSTSIENNTDEPTQDDKDNIFKNKIEPTDIINKPYSYWYDSISDTDLKPAKLIDMDIQGSNKIQSVTEPAKTITYFNGPVNAHDFRKLPYYYPVSAFQRILSYTNPQPIQTQCKKKEQPKQQNVVKKQKDIRPSLYLPYPFTYIHHYNSTFPKMYLNKYYYDKYAIYSKSNRVNPYMPYIAQLPSNAVLINPHLTDDTINDVEMKHADENKAKSTVNKSDKDENAMPAWQTPPLSKDILEEVRAHIQEKAKIIKPFRKNVKLERVGKVIKLDDLVRPKRQVIEPILPRKENPLYEVFLDKTTCNADETVPGFFRFGNLTQPYPECCPQRISN